MTVTVLLTLGRLPKCLDIARALAARGCRVLIAEPHLRHLSGRSNSTAASFTVPSPVADRVGYVQALQDIVRREQVDLVIPVSEECLYVSALQGEPLAPAKLWGMPFETISALHDKAAFAALCQTLSLPTPETHRLDSTAAQRLAAAADYVIKPRFSCAGQGITLAPAGTPLPPSPGAGDWLLQRQLPGDHCSTFSVAHMGRVLLTVCYRPCILSGTVAVNFERIALPAAAKETIRRIAAETRYSGFLSFDFIDDAEGVATVLECNPRATSGIHFVEPNCLASAMLEPDTFAAPELRSTRRLQQFYPCLTETQAAMLRGEGFMDKLRLLLRTRDVTFSWQDPLPFLLMPYCAWPIMSQALFGGRSFGEAATHDIEWFPERAAHGH